MYVFDSMDVAKNKLLVIVSVVFPVLFFLPLIATPESHYGRFYSNQTLLILIGCLLSRIPILGWILFIFVAILYVINIINAASGYGKELPLVGKIKIID